MWYAAVENEQPRRDGGVEGTQRKSTHNSQLSIIKYLLLRAPTRTRTWNPLIKSPTMTTQNTQNGALLGTWVAINCYRLPQISIELLHFHCTHSGLSPPTLNESQEELPRAVNTSLSSL